MNHSEAMEKMAAERYLLNELAPEAREEFEEHVFDCPECALDLRAGAAFVHEVKAQLPAIGAISPAPTTVVRPSPKPRFWQVLWRPAFAAPAFAALLLIVVFQNAVTFPALRVAATEPRLVPLTPLHSATRGGSRLTISADRAHGVALPVDLPVEAGPAPAITYAFDLRDPQGTLAWSATIPAPTQDSAAGQQFSLVIPGSMLRNGTYSLTVTSVDAHGGRTPAELYDFDIVMTQ
jgi:hypothetical protein